MKKHIMISAVLLGSLAYGQVGINTEEPKATLDVVASPDKPESIDGFIAPRLKGTELKDKDALYTADQEGTIVYVTEALDGNNSTTTTEDDVTTKTVNVTSVGYYYFDGDVWQTLKATEPWKVSGTTNDATSNTQNIYQMGKVAIGMNPSSVPSARLHVVESNSQGNTGTENGILNSVTSNRQGPKYGIRNEMIDNSTEGSGSNYGILSNTYDYSKVLRQGFGGFFSYTLNGSKNNGNTTHVHGLSNNINLSAIGGDLTTGYSYANVANANATTYSGNLTYNTLRGYSGYAFSNAIPGYTITGGELMGGHLVARPNPSGGTVNLNSAVGVTAQFEPQGSGGTVNVTDYAAALRAYVQFLEGSSKNINTLYGLYVHKRQSGGAVSINNSYGIYISDFRFTGDNAATAYNFYSEGANTKNYFQGKVGIGAGANEPASNLKVTGLQNLADNAAALGAGLAVGDFYHTDGVVKVVY